MFPLAEIFAPTIPPRVQAVALVASVVLLGVVIRLIQKDMLKAGYSIIWFVIGALLVALSLFTRMLDVVAEIAGIDYAPAALVLVLGGGLFVLALHYSVMVSSHDKKIRELTQEQALYKAELLAELSKRHPDE